MLKQRICLHTNWPNKTKCNLVFFSVFFNVHKQAQKGRILYEQHRDEEVGEGWEGGKLDGGGFSDGDGSDDGGGDFFLDEGILFGQVEIATGYDKTNVRRVNGPLETFELENGLGANDPGG